MTAVRVPTDTEYAMYDGAHTPHLWRQVGETWRCPGCARTRRECLRWTLRTPNGQRFWGWMAGLHRHHDHGYPARFVEVVVCDQCNSADGLAKRLLGLDEHFSFSPGEIGYFVTATPHGRHRLDLERAAEAYEYVRAFAPLVDAADLAPGGAEAAG